MLYEQELRQMYAELEKNPVRISYPAWQPSNYPMTKDGRRKLKIFMWDHRFETHYSFGSCLIIHYKPKELYENFGVQELRFYVGEDKLDFASLRYYHQTDKVLDLARKPLMQLYQDVKHKLFGEPFTNPFQQQK